MADVYGSDTATYRPPPETEKRRRQFLSGMDAVRQAFGVKDRNLKPQAKYVQKPERIPTKGGSTAKPRKKLTGTVPLKLRKKMLAAKLRKAGVRTVAGYFAKYRKAG